MTKDKNGFIKEQLEILKDGLYMTKEILEEPMIIQKENSSIFKRQFTLIKQIIIYLSNFVNKTLEERRTEKDEE